MQPSGLHQLQRPLDTGLGNRLLSGKLLGEFYLFSSLPVHCINPSMFKALNIGFLVVNLEVEMLIGKILAQPDIGRTGMSLHALVT